MSKTTPKVKMYSTRFCPYCMQARSLLKGKGVVFEDISVDRNPGLRSKMQRLSGRHTVPQIWIGDQHVGGFMELWGLDRQGELDRLLAA